jgi:beta-glucosidase
VSLEAKEITQSLSLDDKIKLLSGKDFWHLHEIPSVQLKSIMVTDGPHGLRKQKESEGDHLGISNSVEATCFPTAVGLASSWNQDLLFQMGEYLGEECLSEQVSVLLGPGVNIKRSPLCGRNFEYFSEDPLLTGKLAASYIKGVQSKGIGTSLKHFAVNNQETMRMGVDAIVDERTFREIYLKGFEIAVKEAQPWTVMSAYNKVNGTYASENKKLLQTILKDEWKHEGLVVTDWGANNDRVQGLIAGQELEMPGNNGIHSKAVKEAVLSGRISVELLDNRVERIVELIIKSNEILNQDHPAYNQDDHHEFARRVAQESMVLLKNDDQILPLKPNQKVALIGAFAKTPRFQGSGSSLIKPTKLTNAYDAFKEILNDQLLYAPGYDPRTDQIDQSLIDEAVEIAKEADVVVIMCGLTDQYESEGFDREHLNLPDNHEALIEAIVKNHKKVIVALSNGAPVSMPWNHQVSAILEQYLGGQASGEALADIVFGKVNPSGKLAETFPNQLAEIPASKFFPGQPRRVEYREGLHVGYRAYDSLQIEPLYPFGYGLSYTTFDYQNLNVEQDEESIHIEFDLSNTGSFEGKEIVQVYVSKPDSKVYRPSQELKGFTKVQLMPSESKQVNISIPIKDLGIYQDGFKVESGIYEIRLGSSSRDLKLTETIAIQTQDQVMEESHSYYVKKEERHFKPSQADFEVLLGYKLPDYPQSKPYTLNSTIGEIKHSFIGKQLYKMVKKQMAQMLDQEPNETMVKMMEKSVEEMPFRSLVVFSGGKLSVNRAQGLVDMMNAKVLRGLVKLIKG